MTATAQCTNTFFTKIARISEKRDTFKEVGNKYPFSVNQENTKHL